MLWQNWLLTQLIHLYLEKTTDIASIFYHYQSRGGSNPCSIFLLYFPSNARRVQKLICQTAMENHSTLKHSALSESHSSTWTLQINNWE